MQAAIGIAQLQKLPFFIEKRKKNFEHLAERLKDLERFFLLPRAAQDSDPSWFGYLITLKDETLFTRNALVEFLEKRNIQTRNLFAGNIVRHPAAAYLQEGKDYRIADTLEKTDKIMNDSFWLGVYPGMRQEALKYVTESIPEFIDRY